MEEVMLTNSFGVEVGGREYMALFAALAVSCTKHYGWWGGWMLIGV